MTKKSLRRVAAIAALATVGGLAAPLLTAGPAAASEPTGLSVTPKTAFIAAGGSQIFTVNLAGTGSNGTPPAHGVYFAVIDGPDQPGGGPLEGTACTPDSGFGPFTCTVANNGTPGVDSLRFFYDATGTNNFQNGDANDTATLTIGGAVDSVLLTPAGQHSAQGVYQAYQVVATDDGGRPVPGAAVSVEATQSNAVDANLSLTASAPIPTTNFGQASPTGGGNADVTGTATTADGTGGTSPGQAVMYLASQVAGTVNLQASTDPMNAAITSSGNLVVDPSGVNDVTIVQLNPDPQNAFRGKTVIETVTLRNAQGDLVAGVAPYSGSGTGLTGKVTGANSGATVTVAGTTNGLGQTKISYSGDNAGTDSLVAFVNQSNHANNTGGLDAGEPWGTATVNVMAENIGSLNATHTVVPAGTSSAIVTFTLRDLSDGPRTGVQLDFTVNPNNHYGLAQTTGVTDENGQVAVTVIADATGSLDGGVASVTATVTLDPTVSTTGTVEWQNRAAHTTIITPYAGTDAADGSSSSYSASTTDQFGDPITNVTYNWVVTGRNNPGNNETATGTGTTFSYTDKGPALNAGQSGTDTVTVTATDNHGVSSADSVQQYWVPGSATAIQVNGDLDPFNGEYVRNGVGPFIATDFTKSGTAGLTPNPSAGDSSTVTPVEVKLIDENGNPLFGHRVAFSSSGVGGFTDNTGHSLTTPTTTSALVCDYSGAHGENGNSCDGQLGTATVFVRSNQPGTETITVTADGINDQVRVTYSGQYVPVEPRRVADTRSGQGGISLAGGVANAAAVSGQLAKNTLYYFRYNATDVPRDVQAHVFNVTAIKPSGGGNLRVAPLCNEGGSVPATDVPATSLINYQPGKDVANLVVVPDDCEGLRIYSAGSAAAVAIDLTGYYSTSDGISDIAPTRVADTRLSQGGAGPILGNTSRSFQIAGLVGIPAGARAVALNVTVVQPSGGGNLRIYPDGNAVPNSSSVNYIPGVDKAAFVVVKLPANGKIDLYSAASAADVVIDAFAYYPMSANLVTRSPARILDTRHGAPLHSGMPRNVQVAGLADVPTDAQAVLVSVTAIHTSNSTGVGNLRVYPAGQSLPTVSTLNYVSPTSDVANFAIVKLGTGGQITLYSGHSEIDVALDVVGYVPSGS